ncbi:conserved phage C-terminal domain-containing protein [Elizabethkingia anophelis]|nr:conserved phage C-terminal domain-containing protein [Elizabethkingia anophelis]
MKRESFVFYASWVEAIKDLPNDIRLEIYDGIMEYAMTGNLPDLKPMAKVAFNFIKNGLDRNSDKYSETIKSRSESGRLGNLKRYNEDLYHLVKEEKLSLEQAEIIAKDRKCDNSDRENSQNLANVAKLAVNVNDNVNDNNIVLPNGNCRVPEISVPVTTPETPEEETLPTSPTPPKQTNTDRIDFANLLKSINKYTGRGFKVINDKVKKSYRARLKDGYTKETILRAIKNAAKSEYHRSNECQYLTPEFFSRSDTLDKYGNDTSATKNVEPNKTVTSEGVWSV